MKLHLINIQYDTPKGWFVYNGFIKVPLNICGKGINISPAKVFEQAFGFSIPNYSRVLY